MRNIFLLFSLLLLTGSCFKTNQLSQEERIIYNIIEKFSKNKRNHGFCLVATGLGQNSFEVTFKVDQVLTVESGRKLGIESVNEFLCYINNQENFRNHLIEYPLTEKYVCVIIIGKEPVDSKIPFIKSVHAGGGYLYYYSIGAPLTRLLRKETFEEAVRILEE